MGEIGRLCKERGVLLAIDAATGKQVFRKKLSSPPCFDGMSAAGDTLFFVTRDGKLAAWK